MPIMLMVLATQTSLRSQDPTVQAIINETDIDSLVYFVKELSGEVQTIINGTHYTIASRHYTQPGNDMAANYIKQ